MLDTMIRALLFPLLVFQGKAVRRTARVLPEADGPRDGVAGEGRALRLLILGDSSAAGVGVKHQREALAGQLVALLTQTNRVTWCVHARSGATTRSTLARLDALAGQRFDVAVLALGVNDTTRLVPVWLWRRQQSRLMDRLVQEFGVTRICASGLPPIERFPLLPEPLRWTLGRHAKKLDRALSGIVTSREDADYIEMAFPDDPSLMAVDGFHPSASVYMVWAQRIAQTLRTPD